MSGNEPDMPGSENGATYKSKFGRVDERLLRIIDAFQRIGEGACFTELIPTLNDLPLWQYWNLYREPSMLEDAVSHCAMQMIKGLRKGRVISKPATYAMEVIKNELVELNKKRDRQLFTDPSEQAALHHRHMDADDKSYMAELVSCAMRLLGEECRKLLELTYKFGRTVVWIWKNIAKYRKLSRRTVYNKVERCVDELRERALTMLS